MTTYHINEERLRHFWGTGMSLRQCARKLHIPQGALRDEIERLGLKRNNTRDVRTHKVVASGYGMGITEYAVTLPREPWRAAE